MKAGSNMEIPLGVYLETLLETRDRLLALATPDNSAKHRAGQVERMLRDGLNAARQAMRLAEHSPDGRGEARLVAPGVPPETKR